jgi:Protein of unknown function (DUF2970)
MWKTIKAVLWGFLGIRSKQGYDEDRQQLNVKHVIIAGIVCAIVFVGILFTLVKFITAK